jgi:hypothetical protein
MFVLFIMLFLIYCMFFLCDGVDNVPFEEGQVLQFEEEMQQFGEEGKWTSTPTNSFWSQ